MENPSEKLRATLFGPRRPSKEAKRNSPEDNLSHKVSTKSGQYDQFDHNQYPGHDGLQVVPPPDGLQIAAHEHDPAFNLPQANANQLPWRPTEPESSPGSRLDVKAPDTSRTKRTCGIPRRRLLWIGSIVLLLLTLVIVLATALGVILSRNSKKYIPFLRLVEQVAKLMTL